MVGGDKPLQKGGETCFRHDEVVGGGHNNFWGSFKTEGRSFSHTERGGGGCKKGCVPTISPICSPLPSVINDQSLGGRESDAEKALTPVQHGNTFKHLPSVIDASPFSKPLGASSSH